MEELTIGVVGNPNSGKTTFFNALTGSTQRVGNWPGVTVERKEGWFVSDDTKVKVTDLPGIYSLDATSEDEKIALDYILSGKMDMLINILDATNLERNLYLTLQLTEMKVPLMVVVNMLDIAESRNIKIDLDELSKRLGVPVHGLTATNASQVTILKPDISMNAVKKPISAISIPYPLAITEWLDGNMQDFPVTAKKMNVPARWVALRVLEHTDIVINKAKGNREYSEKKYSEVIQYLGLGDSPELLIAESRYLSAKTINNSIIKAQGARVNFSDRIDSVVLNRILGIPVFLIMMYLVFWATLSIGGAFIDFFDIAFGAVFVDGLAALLSNIGLPAWIVTILASGVGAGIQTVSTFIPIVFMMFLCLSILEDSGYMARAAFVMDRFMRTIGLPGKSFVPMLVGFGCSVPAVMASRTLDSTRDRILTIFMTPFMSCGARLPVYALFGAAFFGTGAGIMVFSVYIVGFMLAIATGLLMKNTLLKGEPSYFIMELPPYHAPRPMAILRQAWNRLKGFIVRAGKVIIIMVGLLGFLNSMGTDGSFGNEDADNSVLAAIGSAINPVFEPMGVAEDNWPASVALFTGLFAKEAVVGTLNSLYSQRDSEGEEALEAEAFSLGASLSEAFATIPENLRGVFGGLLDPLGVGVVGGDEEATAEEVGADTSIYTSMRANFSEGSIQVYAYLLFILLYVPCMAAMGAVTREIGLKLAAILAVYLTLLAWIVSTLVYQIGIGHNAVWIATAVIMMVAVAMGLRTLGKLRNRIDGD
jgi:ferrous iron transport protein B